MDLVLPYSQYKLVVPPMQTHICFYYTSYAFPRDLSFFFFLFLFSFLLSFLLSEVVHGYKAENLNAQLLGLNKF